MFIRVLSFLVVVAFVVVPGIAGDVEVKGVHLCCGSCVKGVDKALKDVTGVSNVKCDRESKTVKFSADDDKAATAGVEALAKAGFHGSATHGDAKVDFPESGAKEGARASRIKVGHVHLCCGACVRAADEAIKKVDGVNNVTADREASSIEVSGDNVSVEAVVKALNGAGFHATVE